MRLFIPALHTSSILPLSSLAGSGWPPTVREGAGAGSGRLRSPAWVMNPQIRALERCQRHPAQEHRRAHGKASHNKITQASAMRSLPTRASCARERMVLALSRGGCHGPQTKEHARDGQFRDPAALRRQRGAATGGLHRRELCRRGAGLREARLPAGRALLRRRRGRVVPAAPAAACARSGARHDGLRHAPYAQGALNGCRGGRMRAAAFPPHCNCLCRSHALRPASPAAASRRLFDGPCAGSAAGAARRAACARHHAAHGRAGARIAALSVLQPGGNARRRAMRLGRHSRAIPPAAEPSRCCG